MATLTYHIVNVFTRGDDRFSGNPLCVFENGESLDTATMQALALQFNLSETTFLLPSQHASASSHRTTRCALRVIRRLAQLTSAVPLDGPGTA